jgi:hypothetical protein
MRSKHIAALIIFLATFSVSAFIASLFAEPKIFEVPPVNLVERKVPKACDREMCEKITEFLLQDKRNGQTRRRSERSEEDSSSELSNEAARAYEYFDKSSSMDYSYFPRVFQAAWSKHMKAWGDYAEFLREENYKEEISDDFFQRRKEHIAAISSTWYKVLDVGRENCADFPEDF